MSVKKDTRKLDAILRNIGKNKGKASLEAANDVAALARANAPVDTGEMRDSIHVEVDGDAHNVVVGADHGVFVEFGTAKMAAQPYLGPAVMKVRRKLPQYYKRVVTND